MTDSYHFQIEPAPRVESVWFDGYFLIGAEQSLLYFPSGAALQLAGDKIVARVPAPLTMTVTEWQAANMDDRLQIEPQRAPLPNSDAWRYTGKERDDFPDFTVTHEQVIDFILPANRPAPKGSTLHAHPGKGSALLLG